MSITLKRKLRWAVLAPAILAALLLGWLGYRYAHLVACENATMRNTRKLQLAFEKWAVYQVDELNPEGATLPRDFEPYIQHGYLDKVPINPFNGHPVRILKLGEQAAAGDIRLLAAKKFYWLQGSPARYAYTGYILIAYGVTAHDHSLDLDGDGFADPVVVLLTPGYASGKHYDDGPEPIKDTLSRYGYKLSPGTSLPVDRWALWRYLLGF
jgi:hypothetical protein